MTQKKIEITFNELIIGYIITSVPDLFGEENRNQRNSISKMFFHVNKKILILLIEYDIKK